MRRHLALVFAAVFVIFAVLGFPFLYYLWLLQRTDVVGRVLEPDLLHALAIPGIIVELEKEKGIRSLDGTVLELDRRDLNFLLQTSFTEEQLHQKALEVHRSIVRNGQVGPRDTFSFAISTKEELPIVQKNLIRIFQRKLVSRPECSMGQFLGVAWRSGIGKLFGVRPPSPEEQLRKLPHCRPPKMVQEGVMKAVQARLERAQENAPDSLLVRPAFGPKTHRFVRKMLEAGHVAPWLLPVFPALLIVIALLSLKDETSGYARLAAPLLISGLLLLLINLPLFYFYHDLDLFWTIQKVDPGYRMSESTGQWLQVVFYLLRQVMKVAARNVALVAGFLILAGLVLVRQHQRHRQRRPQLQIDTPSVNGIGSAAIPATLPATDQDDPDAASRVLL